jgi:hypothetical protein
MLYQNTHAASEWARTCIVEPEPYCTVLKLNALMRMFFVQARLFVNLKNHTWAQPQ